jgi:ribosome maturation factor RimP
VFILESVDTIRKIADDVAKRMKLEIFDVNFRKQKGRSLLNIVIDDPMGYVSVEQCEKFSKEINPILDA